MVQHGSLRVRSVRQLWQRAALLLRSPRSHYQNWDTALEKNWLFSEAMRIQFRFETFNTFNHPNLYTPEAGATAGRVATPTAAPVAQAVSEPLHKPSHHVTSSGLGNSTGKCPVAMIGKTLGMVMLGGFTFGLAQQPPTSLESLFGAAQQAQRSGDYPTAVSDYTLAAKMRPDMPVVWANLGLTQQEAGNIPAAIAAFQRANRLDPSLYVPNLFLGIDYAHSGKAQQAVPFLIKAEETNTADAQAPLALGRAYIAGREYGEAIPELDRALHLNPKLSTAWFDLGIAQLDQVENDARIISIENKQSPFAGALYAESLVKQGRFGEAASLYKTILDSRPQPPCMHSELGFALIRNHNATEAESAFAAERTAHPECGLALLGQARLAADGGNMNEAFALLHQLWQRDGGFFACNAAILLGGMASEAQSALLSQVNKEANDPEFREALATALDADGACSAQPSDAAPASPSRAADASYASGQFAACLSPAGGGSSFGHRQAATAGCVFLLHRR